MQTGITKKKKVERKTQERQTEKKRYIKKTAEYVLLTIMVIIVTLLLFVGPFMRGLFFPREFLFANAFIFGLLIIWGLFRIIKGEGLFINSSLDICLTVLFLAYVASFFVAVHKRDAFTEVLKTASYLIIYLVALDISRFYYLPWMKKKPTKNEVVREDARSVPPGANLLLHLALISAFAIAIASIGIIAGHWDFPFSYDSSRIATPIGYANTAAAYLMAAYFLAVGLAPLARKWLRVIYLALSVVILLVVILTFSRGAWLLLPPLSILLVLVSAPGERLRSFLYLLSTGLTAAIMALFADSIIQSSSPTLIWPVVIASSVVVILLGLIVDLYFSQDRKFRIALASVATAFLLLFLIITIAVPLFSPLHLETSVTEPVQIKTLEQVIENVSAGETYKLTLEAKVDYYIQPEAELPEYVWGIKVLSGLPGYEYVELLDYRAGVTKNWQKKEFTFQTNEDTNRLEIHIFNQFPGTSVTVRSVILNSADKEQNLCFAFNRILPQRFYDRIFSYSRDRNVDRRFELFRDAAKVIKDYPILGLGGGGWAAVYKGYQEQHYNSKQIHNHYLQVWVEAGIFGFLAFIGIWLSFTAIFVRNCYKDRVSPEMRKLWTASFIPCAALALHSAIDWNFAYTSVGIFLFVLIGVGISMNCRQWVKHDKSSKRKSGHGGLLIGILAIIIGTFMLIYTISLIVGLYATWRSQELMAQNNLKQATMEMEKGIRFDPLRADNYHNLSILLEGQVLRTQNPAAIQNMLVLAQQAYELEPYNIYYITRYGQLLLNYVNIEEGFSYIDRSYELSPFIESNYLYPAYSRLTLAEFYIESGNPDKAEPYLIEVLELEIIMEEKYGSSEPLTFALGRACHLMGDKSSAVKYYSAVQESDQYYNEAQRFLAEILE